ncbi:MAG: pyridoxamine 5'-phosphate oxidase [Anaerolineae bacterium]|nr:pyridoxamine 5'-phosphate oxidase [Anaerolineae bacterium]
MARTIVDRPRMRGYGLEGAGTEGLLPWEWVSERMARSRSYWVAVTHAGMPHVTPVWGVWLDEALYFGAGSRSSKAHALAADPRLVVHLESGDEVVILEGRVERVGNLTVFARLEPLYAEKYGYHPFKGTGVPQNDDPWYVVRVTKALAWVENDFLRTATRWRFIGGGENRKK